MNLASINAVLIILIVSLTTSSIGPFQAASAFVHITSPSRNEAVPAGSTIEVSGTSDDNTQFNCNIQVYIPLGLAKYNPLKFASALFAGKLV